MTDIVKSNGDEQVEISTTKEGQELAVAYQIDPVEEKAVLRKLDRVILPLMALVYFFQYLDKQSINYAAVFGLSDDLQLSGTEFSWAISLFYFGQFVSEYPAAYMMSRFPITLFVGITVILWGLCEISLGATQNWPGLATARFFLGFTEGAVAPSFMIITSGWYKRSEHPVRIATWVSMFGISQIVGGVMMYCIGGAHMALASWRVLFLVCGGLTVTCGILFMIFMPRSTTTAWFLNERERNIATERLAVDRATRDRSSFDVAQLKEALTDPRTALYALMALFITLPTPIVKFSSLVISGFGFTPFRTMLVGLPGGAISFALVWVGALGPALRPNTRCFIGIFVAAMPMMGTLLLLLLPASNSWGIVVSTWFAGSTAPPLSVTVGLMASNVKGNTKKSVVSAVFFIFYTIGCIVGPQLWQKKDAPRYTKGCITSVVSFCCLIICYIVYYMTAKISNRNREAIMDMDEPMDSNGCQVGVSVDSDHTEKQDMAFRYSY
ncbi:MFS general substrate transporter [Aaosphaeria arxii CBS 175.79]|uniref:MFS general substrate transporter n=1 Tax=Aaosphaeria arxii CBS 175.79 TaxID=1450172 RepID=A0A6A5Y3P7_9PLEO|nr:MFS general substrate transporter [Aaosphaeria arxii CBS 175.79]KAF2019843.1 MFS general substrate transporter [Aaosphaeria arxii CBS 175.79]